MTVDQSDQVIESLLSKALDAVELIGQTRRDGKMKVIVKTMRCDGNLSIGAETPEELAVSIVGELIKVRAEKGKCL